MKSRSWLAIGLLLILLAGGLLAACGGPSSTSSPTASPTPSVTPTQTPEPTGVVEVRATDAPPENISSIIVTTDNIQAHKANAPEQSWITLVDEERTFDLVAIQGAEVFLGEQEMEVGQYTQIRLDVTKVIVVLEGEEIEAELPGDKLKVVRQWEVIQNEKTILTLDFEAEKFVVVTGQGRA